MPLGFHSSILKGIRLSLAFYCAFLMKYYFDKWPQSKLPGLTRDIYALGNETHACLWIGSVCCSAELAPVWLSLGKALGADDGLGSVSSLPIFPYLHLSSFTSTLLQWITFDIQTAMKWKYFSQPVILRCQFLMAMVYEGVSRLRKNLMPFEVQWT